MKKDFTSDFAQIKAMTNKIRGKQLNESINFEDDYEGEGMPYSEQGEFEQAPEEEVSSEEQEINTEVNDENSPLNQIREICLKGMISLCHTPEDPQYQVLKKVFSMIDKANDKKEENQ